MVVVADTLKPRVFESDRGGDRGDICSAQLAGNMGSSILAVCMEERYVSLPSSAMDCCLIGFFDTI